jgi:hypothetical protein
VNMGSNSVYFREGSTFQEKIKPYSGSNNKCSRENVVRI